VSRSAEEGAGLLRGHPESHDGVAVPADEIALAGLKLPNLALRQLGEASGLEFFREIFRCVIAGRRHGDKVQKLLRVLVRHGVSYLGFHIHSPLSIAQSHKTVKEGKWGRYDEN
jgi:hypothetical protein